MSSTSDQKQYELAGLTDEEGKLRAYVHGKSEIWVPPTVSMKQLDSYHRMTTQERGTMMGLDLLSSSAERSGTSKSPSSPSYLSFPISKNWQEKMPLKTSYDITHRKELAARGKSLPWGQSALFRNRMPV